MIQDQIHCNYKNEDQIWYKIKVSRDEIEKQINSITNSRPNTLQWKKMRI